MSEDFDKSDFNSREYLEVRLRKLEEIVCRIVHVLRDSRHELSTMRTRSYHVQRQDQSVVRDCDLILSELRDLLGHEEE